MYNYFKVKSFSKICSFSWSIFVDALCSQVISSLKLVMYVFRSFATFKLFADYCIIRTVVCASCWVPCKLLNTSCLCCSHKTQALRNVQFLFVSDNPVLDITLSFNSIAACYSCFRYLNFLWLVWMHKFLRPRRRDGTVHYFLFLFHKIIKFEWKFFPLVSGMYRLIRRTNGETSLLVEDCIQNCVVYLSSNLSVSIIY